MPDFLIDDAYKNWLTELKGRIQTSQIKAALAVNSALVLLYWELGRQIAEKQETAKWGSGLVDRLAHDLKLEFPDLGGFSKTNLIYCRKFFQFYRELSIGEQAVHQLKMPNLVEKYCLQIPWGHNLVILKRLRDAESAIFYLKETIANNWSRSILEMQIESKLHERQGKAITNFEYTLPKPQSDLARQLLKDPYNFDFLTLEKDVQELELERKLVGNITRFLLELGKGFAYMGRQYPLKVGTKEYRLDLLFYHVRLKCYVVVELKTVAFEPEFVGKLNFYLSAIDGVVKDDSDQSTIGILLCKTKDNLNVEFALKDINKPIGVSEFSFQELPWEIQREIPTVAEFEAQLSTIEL
jgi:predicted nuclease of restriction endonuclease-like (RecB) superfamily